MRGFQLGKEEAKLSFIAGDIALYVAIAQDAIEKLRDWTKEFGKVAGSKSYVKEPTAFLTPMKNSQKEKLKKHSRLPSQLRNQGTEE